MPALKALCNGNLELSIMCQCSILRSANRTDFGGRDHGATKGLDEGQAQESQGES